MTSKPKKSRKALKRKHHARGLLWGRMLSNLDVAVDALKTATAEAPELLDKKSAKELQYLYEDLQAQIMWAWTQQDQELLK